MQWRFGWLVVSREKFARDEGKSGSPTQATPSARLHLAHIQQRVVLPETLDVSLNPDASPASRSASHDTSHARILFGSSTAEEKGIPVGRADTEGHRFGEHSAVVFVAVVVGRQHQTWPCGAERIASRRRARRVSIHTCACIFRRASWLTLPLIFECAPMTCRAPTMVRGSTESAHPRKDPYCFCRQGCLCRDTTHRSRVAQGKARDGR